MFWCFRDFCLCVCLMIIVDQDFELLEAKQFDDNKLHDGKVAAKPGGIRIELEQIK